MYEKLKNYCLEQVLKRGDIAKKFVLRNEVVENLFVISIIVKTKRIFLHGLLDKDFSEFHYKELNLGVNFLSLYILKFRL